MTMNWNECKPLNDADLHKTACKALSGDSSAIDKLVKGNVKLAASIAHSFKSFDGNNTDDLVSEGMLGLVEAIPLFDPDRGVKFTTFASWHIKKRVLSFVIDNFRLVKIGTTQAQRKLFWRLNRETRNLKREGLDPTSKAIADRLAVKVSEVESMQTRMTQSECSLDAPIDNQVHSSGPVSLFDMIDGNAVSPESYATKSRMQAWVQAQMITFEQRLSGKILQIWNHRIADGKSLQDTAEIAGVTRQYVNLIEKKLHKSFVKYARNQAR